MAIYEFSNGNFEQIEYPLPEDRDEGHEGYMCVHWLESESIRFFQPLKNGSQYQYQHIVEVCPFMGDVVANIFVRNIPDFLQLLALLQPLFALEALDLKIEQADLVRKTFRLQHGHGTTDICDQCDPAEMQRRRENRNKRKDSVA